MFFCHYLLITHSENYFQKNRRLADPRQNDGPRSLRPRPLWVPARVRIQEWTQPRPQRQPPRHRNRQPKQPSRPLLRPQRLSRRLRRMEGLRGARCPRESAAAAMVPVEVAVAAAAVVEAVETVVKQLQVPQNIFSGSNIRIRSGRTRCHSSAKNP